MIELLNEDCMIVMARYPDKYFDLAIVDPPYGIGDTWSKQRTDRFYQKGKIRTYQNTLRPGMEYFNELFRVSKNQIIWGGNYFADLLPVSNAWVIWHKHSNGDLILMSEAEMAWSSFTKTTRVFKLNWSGGVKCEPGDKIHPHQKPIKLYARCLKHYANKGDKILDTHCGSGSSAIAAEIQGFDFVRCEIDAEYHAAAVKRFNLAIQQQSMF